MEESRNFQAGMMQRQRQATVQIETRQNRQDQKIKKMEGTVQPSVYQQKNAGVAAAPDMPVAEAPAKKFHQTLGRLSEKERTETHSDIQRMAFKQNLLQNVAMDEKGGYSQQFQDMLQMVKAFAQINVTGDAKGQNKDLIETEQTHLARIMETIRTLHQSMEIQKSQTEEWAQAQERELKALKIYEDYFSLDTSGYLKVPEEAANTKEEDRRVIDCTHKNMTGTYEVEERKMVNGEMVIEKVKKTIVMKDVPRETPLFPHEPSINDVAQGGLGDCYLLAALSAIIHRNPQLIKECMKDHGDGTVTVRLFRNISKTGDGESSLVPYYVKVKKAVPEGQPYASGSLWVQMIEHAYAASGYHKENQGGNYNDISGGDSAGFIQTITGKIAVKRGIRHTGSSPSDFVTQLLNQAASHLQTANPQQAGGNMLDAAALVFPVTLTETQQANKVLVVVNIQAAYGAYFQNMKKSLENIEEMRAYLNSLDYKTLPDVSVLTPEQNLEVKQGFLQQLKKLYLEESTTALNHKAFSENYTPYALEVYEQIRQGQEQGKIMTASTLNTFRSQQNGAGLNGEGMEQGMASKHAYTLLGVKQKGKNRYVELRNPWAIGTRAYDRSTLSGNITRKRQDEGTHGIFLLELNEFMDHYDDVSFQ